MDLNAVLAAVSLLLFLALVGFFGFAVFHEQSVEPREPSGAELIEQHYAPGETVEQPTPYYVAPIPAAPDPLEISANLDKKIVIGGAMVFGFFALLRVYFFFPFLPPPAAGPRPRPWPGPRPFSPPGEKPIHRRR